MASPLLPDAIDDARVALVHDYLTQRGGAEKVAGMLARRLPAARLLTSVHLQDRVPIDFAGGRPWRTSFLQQPARVAPLKSLLALLPRALSSLDTSGSELVISSSSAFAHHARRPGDALHVCYCHTPAHFLWNQAAYFHGRPALARLLAPLLAHLRRLDLAAADRVDAYVAVSEHIRRRIAAVYGRDAHVVHPPLDVASFQPELERSDRFLVVSRLVPSKRVDVVIEAANILGQPLDVIGVGPELERLRRRAGPTVKVHGWLPDAEVKRAMARCIAVVIAGEEDFGLVTAEAQASGRPPVAFAAGGALEIIEDGVTGFLFPEQTPRAIAEAMLLARQNELDVSDLRASAERFDVPVFEVAFRQAIETATWDRLHAARRLPAASVPLER